MNHAARPPASSYVRSQGPRGMTIRTGVKAQPSPGLSGPKTQRYALQRRIGRGLSRFDEVAVSRPGDQSSVKVAWMVGIGDACGPDYFSM